ncbi:MAG: murein L,D-transpeptidase catalytic domain family protein [Bacteroidota bacterium]|nr:murein L,D-transpeptidase catalytic domain family protein [Bacteroidota bacterium]
MKALMNRKAFKKFYLFLLPVFIFLIHLPFVFAKTKPHSKHSTVVVPTFVRSISNAFTNPLNFNAISKSLLYDSMKLNALGLSKQAFNCAVDGFNYLRSSGKLNNDQVISIVDFSLPSSKKRLFVIDLQNLKVLFNTYVAHGRNSGKEYANRFSNSPESFMSSPGFYITKETYNGEHGFSLKLEGEEKGINDNALSRAIVIHCANYVNENEIKTRGFIGRSLGCPALPEALSKPIIETIKGGSCFFMFSPNSKYLSHSRLLQLAS